jgi:hypothetical protein
MLSWDELELGQVYEILFSCECGRMWFHYTRMQKIWRICECGHTLKPDNYVVLRSNFIGYYEFIGEVVINDSNNAGAMEADTQ